MDDITTPVIPGYEVLDLLGSGSSGQVWVVRRPDGVRLAAKLVASQDPCATSEADLLRRLDHNHVIRLQDTVREDGGTGRTAMIIDLAEGGSLADALDARKILAPGELVTVLTPIARTLHDLHGIGLVHGDISTGNILFTDAGRPMLSDLGFSRVAGSYEDDTWATEAWAAPEVLDGQPAEPASDVYSLGAVAWACVAGSPPPAPVHRPPLLDLAAHTAPEIIALIEQSMSFDAAGRPTPGEFALRLWQCAPAEPAPVAGSRGRRPSTVDPAPNLLTRRMIRQTKQADAAQDQGPVGVSRRCRQAIVKRRRSILAASTSATVTALLAAVAWTAAPLSTSYAVGTVSTSIRPTPSAAKAAGGSSATTAPTPTVSPTQVVSDLVSARAKAWQDKDPAQLDGVLAPGSPADRADRAAIATARGQGVDYRGLRFETTAVSVIARSATRMEVLATISRPSYRVAIKGQPSTTPQAVPATTSQVRLELVQGRGGWLIQQWH